MPLCSWLLSSLLVSQIGGNPSPWRYRRRPLQRLPSAAAYRRFPPGRPIRQAPPVWDGSAPISVELGRQPPAGDDSATGGRRPHPAAGSTISGQPVLLVSVVATAPERQRQIEAVHAYWRLAEALGEYHFCHERQQRLARLPAGK